MREEEMREVVGGTDDKLKSLFSAPLRLINENSSASTQPPTPTGTVAPGILRCAITEEFSFLSSTTPILRRNNKRVY